MKQIKVIEQAGLATVTLARPEVRNAFNPAMIEELRLAFETLSKKEELRAILLKGEGKSFCAGADLAWMRDMVNYSMQENQQDADRLYAMLESIQQCSVPVLGAVHGSAFGGALGLMAVCDYVVCEQSTQLCFSEVKLGISPAVISDFLLRKIAPGYLLALMSSARVFRAEEALRMGLVHELVEEESFSDKVEAIIAQYQQVGPKAARATKKLIQDLEKTEFQNRRKLVTDLIAQLRVSEEGQEGIGAFLEKRSPNWRP